MTDGGGLLQGGGDANRWIERAAQQGLPDAQLALAHVFRDGVGVRRSGADAITWFYQAARQGSAEAQYALGEMYREANSIPVTQVLAYAWFALAGSNGEQHVLQHRSIQCQFGHQLLQPAVFILQLLQLPHLVDFQAGVLLLPPVETLLS
jgi:hypothetical protein